MSVRRGDRVGIKAVNQWMWENKTPIVRETAEVTLLLGDGLYGKTVDLDLSFKALEDGVSIARRGQDKYGGLNVRLAPVKDLQLSNSRQPAWSAASGVWQGGTQLTTLAILEHPSNPEHPADVVTYPELPWFQPTFPQAGKRYDLNKGEPLRLRYRFIILPGAMDPVVLDQAWRAYAR